MSKATEAARVSACADLRSIPLEMVGLLKNSYDVEAENWLMKTLFLITSNLLSWMFRGSSEFFVV
jgi:hypothetical protein